MELVKGTRAMDRNREYVFDRKGQFVIVYNDAFDYTHRGTDWSKQAKLDYPTDAKNIKSTFKLDDDSSNLKFGKNLTPYSKNNESEDQFDGFVDELLLEEDGEPNPSFLMFFLMSHGDRDGEFLLSENAAGSTTPCCEGDDHTFSGRCRARKVYQLIQKIDSAESKKFLNIPKIFVIQACRGSRAEAIPVSKAAPTRKPPPPKPSEADRFIPECSDVFIFYACIENQLSWVANTLGSFAVESFCKSIADTTTANNQSNVLWSKLCIALLGSDNNGDSHEDLKSLNTQILQDRYGLDKLKLGNENVADGWIEGICRQATVKVTDFLIKQCDGYGGHDKFIKQQPQYASTLRFKLSMLKLLDTQCLTGTLV